MNNCFQSDGSADGKSEVDEEAPLTSEEKKDESAPKHKLEKLAARVTGSMQTTADGQEFIVYIISVATEYENWALERRFRDFRKFYNELKLLDLPIIPELPPRRTGGEEKFDINVIEKRKLHLQLFLDEVLSYENIVASEPAHAFFEVPIKDVEEDLCYNAEIGMEDPTGMKQQGARGERSLYRKVAVDPTQKEITLYQTYTLCAQCALSKSKGFHWRRAYVRQRDDDTIWLWHTCPAHGPSRVLLTSNVRFFHHINSFVPDWPFGETGPDFSSKEEQPRLALPDIEDLKKTAGKVPPTVVEVVLFRGARFATEEEIETELDKYARSFSKEYSFLFRLTCKTTTEIERLNDKIMFVKNLVSSSENLAKNNLVLVEGTYDLLCELSALRNSCFFSGGVHPACKMYVAKGNESTCVQELQHLFSTFKENERVRNSMVVTLVMQHKMPALDGLLALVRRQVGLVRALILSPERPPSDVMDRLQHKTTADVEVDEDLEGGPVIEATDNAIDICEIIERIELASAGSISEQDFMPATMGHVLEPFLAVVYNRKFSIRPSTFCAFFTCLVNMDGLISYPITRLMNGKSLFRALSRVLPKQTLSLSHVKPTLKKSQAKLNKVIRSCAHFPDRVPDVMDFFLDHTKRRFTKDTLSATLFILVHNNMDVARVDLARRCGCMSLSTSTLTGNGLTATCTGCL
eukprot:Rmarinus@m.17205